MKDSAISWTDHTFNPWIGCTKVSPGCANCYAATQDKFRKWTPEGWGAGKPRKRTSASNWNEPRRWNRLQETSGAVHHGAARPRVFCASLADWLDDEVPIEWLADLLALVRKTPHLDWLLLSKRPQNWATRLNEVVAWAMARDIHIAPVMQWLTGTPPANVWIGTTVEDQQRADERIPELVNIPARVRFLSCEPLLGPVNLSMRTHRMEMAPGIHWVICGGESGPGARPMHPDWARSLRDQCAAAGVAFHFKQWGEWAPGECVDVKGTLQCASYVDGQRWEFSTQTENQSQHCHADDAPDMFRVGKKSAGRLLDGVEHNAFPKEGGP